MRYFLRFSPAQPARRSWAWLLLLLTGLPWLAQAQCPNNLTTQAQVDAFPPGCTIIPRSLVISGDDIINLDGLRNIQSVNEDLVINPTTKLTSLAGLTALTHVGGGTQIANNAQLTTLDGLNNLQTVGGSGNLEITNNTKLSVCALNSICQILDQFQKLWSILA